jgi:hypothetical protein
MDNRDKPRFKDLNEILPIGTAMSVLGFLFTIFSIAVALVFHYCTDWNKRIIWFIGFGGGAFVLTLIIFFRIAYRKMILQGDSDLIKKIKDCYNCAKKKSKDGFHYYGLLNFGELMAVESKLSKDAEPEECKVLIYTSNLATEFDAGFEVKNNREKNIPYIVLYFTNSCNSNQMAELNKCYGKENLIDLSQIDDYKETVDSKLAITIGFDIVIYENSTGDKEGYFCVDLAPSIPSKKSNKSIIAGSIKKVKIVHERLGHITDCVDKCNYEKNRDPFYKRISDSRTKTLYDEIMAIYGKINDTNKEVAV